MAVVRTMVRRMFCKFNAKRIGTCLFVVLVTFVVDRAWSIRLMRLGGESASRAVVSRAESLTCAHFTTLSKIMIKVKKMYLLS